MISGPIPSPGSVTIWWVLICLLFWLFRAGPAPSGARPARSQGGRRRGDPADVHALALELGDLGCLLERHRDVVQPVEQAVADLVVDLEGGLAPGEAHLLLEQVDLPRPGVCQRAAVLTGEHDRHQPDLRAVGVEDVGEARRDDRLEAVILQAPRRVLARGAAAEVLAGDEDRVGRQIPAGLLCPVVEKELAEAGALDAL